MNYVRNQRILENEKKSSRPEFVYFSKDGSRKEFSGVFSERSVIAFIKRQMDISLMKKIKRKKQYKKILKNKSYFFVRIKF